jgi:SpoVK/Ycf46/Vps4 family AAA+-type ATPase
MRSRGKLTHKWSLQSKDPSSVASARAVLALWRCVRRLPGAFPNRDCDDLGEAIAPLFENQRAAVAQTIKLAAATERGGEFYEFTLKASDAALLHERRVQMLLGRCLAQGESAHEPMIARAEAALVDFVKRHPHPTDGNVEILSSLLSLSAAEREFVLLGAACANGTVGRSPFSFIDTNPRLFKCLETVCGAKATEALSMFQPNRALVRSGLFHGLQSGCSHDFDDILRLSLTGERLLCTPFSGPTEMSAAVLTPLQAPPEPTNLEWPHLETEKALVRSALATACDTRATGFNVLIFGPPGTGKTEFSRALIAEIGGTGFAISHADDNGDEASRLQRLASLRLSQTFAGQQSRPILVVDEAEDIFPGDHQHPLSRLLGPHVNSKAWMNHLLESNAHPVIWISNEVRQLDPAYLRRFAFCLEFPETPYSLRRRIAEERLQGLGCSQEAIQAVAKRPHTEPAVLTAAARFVRMSADSGVSPDIAIQAVLDGQNRALGRQAHPQIPKRATRFDLSYLNIAGNVTPPRLLSGLTADTAAALLFSGPPGTGKTQFAAELASRLGRHLVVRTASDINSKWYGESEGNVAQMFQGCDPKTEVLFLDEAEVLLAARSAGTHRADRAVTAEFLRWLEVFQGIFICATNHPLDFDLALSRRFTFRLTFKPLEQHQREAMYREVALGKSSNDDATLDNWTRERLERMPLLTPGDFANVSRRVRLLGLSAEHWLAELEAEHAAKDARLPIGFT